MRLSALAPRFFFLMQTGLDARSQAVVVAAIRAVAQQGCAVVCTVHQPSAEVFIAFSHLLLVRPCTCIAKRMKWPLFNQFESMPDICIFSERSLPQAATLYTPGLSGTMPRP